MESETESETKSLASYSQTKSELHATPLPNHMASTPPHNSPTHIPVAQPITFVHRPALQTTHHRIPLSPITSLIRNGPGPAEQQPQCNDGEDELDPSAAAIRKQGWGVIAGSQGCVSKCCRYWFLMFKLLYCVLIVMIIIATMFFYDLSVKFNYASPFAWELVYATHFP